MTGSKSVDNSVDNLNLVNHTTCVDDGGDIVQYFAVFFIFYFLFLFFIIILL